MQRSSVDESLMARAIELARSGFPAPNPRVGSVVFAAGEIVGEGFHEFAGGPHAEVAALAAAQGRAKDSTLYVTLEPCHHVGRTPPCTRQVVESGVARVVFACSDPNPRAAGGAAFLREAGIEVVSGVLESDAREVNRRWFIAQERKSPYVVLKAAIGLDGRMATAEGESQWITGEAARAAGRLLRAELGAVLVGRGTVEHDDPQLTVRDDRVKQQPVRVVFDPNGSMRPASKLLDDKAETIWYVDHEPRHPAQRKLPTSNGRFAIDDVLADLWERGLTGVIVEGGSNTHAGFFAANCVDEIQLFVAPKSIGSGPAWSGDWNDSGLEAASIFRLESVDTIESDIRLQFLCK